MVTRFSAKQKTAMTWWANRRYADCDTIICDGAVRSGKTLALGIGFFLWAMRCFDGKQFALCGKTILATAGICRGAGGWSPPGARRVAMNC